MKKLLLLPIICLTICVSGQSLNMLQAAPSYRDYTLPVAATYHHIIYMDSVRKDSTFTYVTGSVLLQNSSVTIDAQSYQVVSRNQLQIDTALDQYWQILTLNGNITCTIRSNSNFEPMDIILQPADDSSTCYCIK